MKKGNAEEETTGPTTGDFVSSPDITDDGDQLLEALPDQEAFWRPPVRFGTIPVEKEPLGWDRRRGFRKLFPEVMLPTQVVDRISFGHKAMEPNRLFWGDNLHVMRQLPSQSIDLIYIDPPFFSGRQYNVIFGDQNELRSFSDIWEGGMPGYLIWFNARLYEMKRVLKKSGSIFVHLDWHAVHYVKVEMDKIFGIGAGSGKRSVAGFRNELIWCYSGGGTPSSEFPRKHDVILWYSKSGQWVFNTQYRPYSEGTRQRGRTQVKGKYFDKGLRPEGTPINDWWPDVKKITSPTDPEKIGYPTQKSEELVGRIISTCTDEGDVVADFFCGGGTTAASAQRLGRRWIACDQSRVAVAITADRLCRLAQKDIGTAIAVPDFTIEHWGVYEAGRLSSTPALQFRKFVLRAFGARPDDSMPGVHGMKGAVPVWVGEPDQRSAATAEDVKTFANAIRKTVRYQQDNLRDGIMVAWAFRPDSVAAAERLLDLEQTDLNFIRLDQVRVDSPRFREHVTALSTDHADYENFLTFVHPPKVEVGWKRLSAKTYKFDVSETALLNAGASIINVQWDFQHRDRFSSTLGYSFLRGKKKEPALQAEYEFPHAGTFKVACKVQDDLGGEGFWVGNVEVE